MLRASSHIVPKHKRRLLYLIKFTEPKALNKPDTRLSRAVAVGTIKPARDSSGNEQPFYQEFQTRGGDIRYRFICDLDSGGNTIRIQGYNSSSKPKQAKDFADMVSPGDYVKILGTLSENVNEKTDRVYRSILAWEIKGIEDEAPRIATTIIGEIDFIDYDLEEGLKLIINASTPGSQYENQFSIRGFNDNPYTQWVVEKNISKGDILKCQCYLHNKVVLDDFGDIESVENYLELYKVPNYISQTSVEVKPKSVGF